MSSRSSLAFWIGSTAYQAEEPRTTVEAENSNSLPAQIKTLGRFIILLANHALSELSKPSGSLDGFSHFTAIGGWKVIQA